MVCRNIKPYNLHFKVKKCRQFRIKVIVYTDYMVLYHVFRNSMAIYYGMFSFTRLSILRQWLLSLKNL